MGISGGAKLCLPTNMRNTLLVPLLTSLLIASMIRMDWVGAAFNPMYTDVMPQLQTLLDPEVGYPEGSAESAIASIWWVYTFHKVTDYWGPIPYFKAGTVDPEVPGVPYDPQDQIYDDFFKRLDAAVTILKGKTAEVPYGRF